MKKIHILFVLLIILTIITGCSNNIDKKDVTYDINVQNIKEDSLKENIETNDTKNIADNDDSESNDYNHTHTNNDSPSNTEYTEPDHSKGDNIEYFYLDDSKLSEVDFYLSNDIYNFTQEDCLVSSTTVVETWPYINGVSCILIDNGNVIAIDENNNLLWHGIHRYTSELWAQNAGIGNAEDFDTFLNVTISSQVDCSMDMYVYNNFFIENTYIEQLYQYDAIKAEKLVLAISDSYALADQNLKILGKIFDLQKSFNKMQNERFKRIFD